MFHDYQGKRVLVGVFAFQENSSCWRSSYGISAGGRFQMC